MSNSRRLPVTRPGWHCRGRARLHRPKEGTPSIAPAGPLAYLTILGPFSAPRPQDWSCLSAPLRSRGRYPHVPGTSFLILTSGPWRNAQEPPSLNPGLFRLGVSALAFGTGRHTRARALPFRSCLLQRVVFLRARPVFSPVRCEGRFPFLGRPRRIQGDQRA
ncbi:hypothetical protein NDU88_007520 [Pleurodeles waltl]|uniref:Uncharacterized protein n=1 Tax=Pleurodeles waltl TaxID=8319 RepID=A0AAV7VUP7_PLEWA|nr:hypothetical protein NDU88_007520 [Pleurodeles waltl]